MNLTTNTLVYGFDRLHENNSLLPSLPLVSRNQAYYFLLTTGGILKIYVSSHLTASNCIWSSEKFEEKGRGGGKVEGNRRREEEARGRRQEEGRVREDVERGRKEERRGKEGGRKEVEGGRIEEEERKKHEGEIEEGYVCRLDEDGILKVSDGKGDMIWKSREYKRGEGPFQLIITDDGNLTIFDGEGEEVWVAGNEERETVYKK